MTQHASIHRSALSKPETFLPNPRATLLLVAAFWSVWFVALTARSLLLEQPDQLRLAMLRLVSVLLAAGLCLGVAALLNRYRSRPFAVRAALALLLTLPAAAIYAQVNNAFGVRSPLAGTGSGAEYLRLLSFIYWLPSFLCWTALHLAMTYSFDIREREQRITQLQALAHRAQLEALQYQINPHFLFNAHNSILALVATGQNGPAERMLRNLSTFLRSSLTLDPMEDVTLAEEIAFQHLYLDIEKVRFPDRLQLDIDIPDDVQSVRVPSLILQPIVENAVKHGVAVSREPTALRIAARRNGNALEVEVSNNRTGPARPGEVIGLQNVRARLSAAYGDAAVLEAARRSDGSYQVLLRLPIRGGR